MKSIAVWATVAVLFASCTSTGPSYREAPLHQASPFRSFSPYPRLKAAMDRLFPDTLFPPSGLGIKIRSLQTGETLYEANPELLLNPGSNEKLFTTAAAVGLLGESHLLTTRLSFDTSVTPKIYIRGEGDPLLSTADIDSMAGVLAKSIPGGKQWAVVGDASFFDDVPWGKGWMWDDEPDPSGMQIAALSVNGNAVRVRVKPGPTIGDSVRVTATPSTSYVTVENTATTVPNDSANTLRIARRWRERSNVVTVTGGLPQKDSSVIAEMSVWQPDLYTVTLLTERLEEKGIICAGTALDTVPRTAVTVMDYTHSLDSVITFMNKVSDNLSAENILKNLGALERGKPGNADSGLCAVREYCAKCGIDTSRLTLADGSGVSRYNLVSAAAIVKLLTVIHDDTAGFRTVYASLPIAGIDGTLKKRMRGTPAEGRVHAKTGTLRGTSSLSGYVTTADGEMLAFSILMQNFHGTSEAYRRVQDGVCEFLASLRRKHR